jgi:hypothetical protein
LLNGEHLTVDLGINQRNLILTGVDTSLNTVLLCFLDDFIQVTGILDLLIDTLLGRLLFGFSRLGPNRGPFLFGIGIEIFQVFLGFRRSRQVLPCCRDVSLQANFP